ncbi:MAG: hypothetical protein H6813_01000 [Phycisphaeraceae bacterium]|nr:hypothetical protein [Phycisphaeraceae bacterium]MCB9847336.1 hypothetical protein [Phycisphaeraceae bacterium]
MSIPFHQVILSTLALAMLIPGAALGAGSDLTPPAATSTPRGSLQVGVGEAVEFTVCGESFVGGDIEIELLDAPAWCRRAHGQGSTQGCVTYVATPDSPGVHVLRFVIIDDENEMETAHSVTIEAGPSQGPAPLCTITPMGPLTVDACDVFSFVVCGEPQSDGETDVQPIGVLPSWVQLTSATGVPRGGSIACNTYECTPMLGDAGQHTLEFLISESTTSETTTCSITINVVACDNAPICTVSPMSPIQTTPGSVFSFEICAETQCDGETDVQPMGLLPPWVQLTGATGVPRGGSIACNTYECSPGMGDVGQHTLSFLLTDAKSTASTVCDVVINVGPVSNDPPTCEFIPASGSIVIPPTGNDQYQICVTSGVPGHVVEFTALDAPGWILDQAASGAQFMDSGCAYGDVHPPLSAAGTTVTVHYLVEDVDSGAQAMCEFNIVVPEAEPPVCEISKEVISVYPGEVDSFDLCATAQNGENEIFYNPSNMAPAYLSPLNGTFFGQGCETLTFAPPLIATPSTHVQVFNITDLGTGEVSQCEITLIVLCPDEPACWFTQQGPVEVAVGEPVNFEFCGYPGCDTSYVRIEMIGRPPFIDPAGHQKGGRGETLCLPITGTPGPEHAGRTYPVRVRTTNLSTGQQTECSILIHVLDTGGCPEAPLCFAEPGEYVGAEPGGEVSLTICAEPGCPDSAVTLEVIELPAFCDDLAMIVGGAGETACAPITCTLPLDTAPGEYPVRLLATDGSSGLTSECVATIVVSQGVRGCFEEEPNNMNSICTMLDAEGCLGLDDCGSFVDGYLGESGDDRDYYCISGLTPDSVYRAMIVGGLSADGTPTCATLACLDESGEIIEITNTGPQGMGRPSLSCLADSTGQIHLAVTGCNDLDLDGQADNPGPGVGGIGHGTRGSYQLLFSLDSPLAVDMPCLADLNGDGLVDSADLGALLGVFGETCAP